MEENNSESPNSDQPIPFSTGKLLILSIISANVYVFLSLLITRFWHEENFYSLFISDTSLWMQLGIGAGAGMLASLIIYLVIQFKPVSEVLSDFMIFEALSKANFTFFDRAQLSFFAGAGEEVLFRGAIQPLLGNTITSIIFIGIHGYIKFKSVGHILFGALMFGLSFMLGLLTAHVGIISAMVAHAVYDLIMLQAIQRENSKLPVKN